MNYLKYILLKLNFKISTLGILFLLVNTNIFATTYYSTTGGAWSTVGYNGASCGCTPDLTSSATIVYINRNDFTAPADWTNCPGVVAPTGSGHTFSAGGTVAATIYVENGGYLYFSSSSTLTTTANITISAGGVVFVNGSLQSPFPANNNTLITIDRFGRLEWNGSLSVYYKIAGAGGIRCCGASSITNDGVQFFGNVRGQTSGNLTCNGTIVPVNFSAVSAELNKSIAVIKWTTAMEQNNAYFLIERSIDGIDFETVDKITGAGNSNQPLYYQFIDKLGYEPAFIYYRIKQVDFDGAYSYSKTFVTHQNRDTNFNVELYPNPNDGKFKAAIFGSYLDDEIEFTLTDLSGHINKVGQLKLNEINELDVSELEKGLYIFSVKTHYETWHKELIIK